MSGPGASTVGAPERARGGAPHPTPRTPPPGSSHQVTHRRPFGGCGGRGGAHGARGVWHWAPSWPLICPSAQRGQWGRTSPGGGGWKQISACGRPPAWTSHPCVPWGGTPPPPPRLCRRGVVATHSPREPPYRTPPRVGRGPRLHAAREGRCTLARGRVQHGVGPADRLLTAGAPPEGTLSWGPVPRARSTLPGSASTALPRASLQEQRARGLRGAARSPRPSCRLPPPPPARRTHPPSAVAPILTPPPAFPIPATAQHPECCKLPALLQRRPLRAL